LWANFVIKLCHQSPAFSGFMVLSRQLGTLKKTSLNHDDVSDLHVGALERGPSFRLAIPSWMTVQKPICPVGDRFFSVTSCLELTEVRFLSSDFQVVLSAAEVMLD
jgi:hypothetical protein